MREAQIKTAVRILIKCKQDTKKYIASIIIYIPSFINYFQTFNTRYSKPKSLKELDDVTDGMKS
jgi:hypothetical protein